MTNRQLRNNQLLEAYVLRSTKNFFGTKHEKIAGQHNLARDIIIQRLDHLNTNLCTSNSSNEN